MNDINIPIRQAYYSLLNGNVSYNGNNIKVYNLFVNDTVTPDIYIVIQAQNSVEISPKCDQMREATIQFLICTKLNYNSGWECDKIADQLLSIVYPNRSSVIDGCLSMDMVSDNTIADYDSEAKKQIVERVIIFKHII